MIQRRAGYCTLGLSFSSTPENSVLHTPLKKKKKKKLFVLTTLVNPQTIPLEITSQALTLVFGLRGRPLSGH